MRKNRFRTCIIAALVVAAGLFVKNIGPGEFTNPDTYEKLHSEFTSVLEKKESEVSTQKTVPSSVQTASITKIADGDTITVLLDGTEYKIRMVAVDTPESVHVDKTKNNTYGETASEYTKSQLSIGQTVYLTMDQSDTDRYDRLLRLVWTDVPEDPFNEQELRTKCFNAKLLLDGYAEVAIFDDDSYEAIFTVFQEEAMNDRRGLWADDSWWEFVGIN